MIKQLRQFNVVIPHKINTNSNCSSGRFDYGGIMISCQINTNYNEDISDFSQSVVVIPYQMNTNYNTCKRMLSHRACCDFIPNQY